MVDFSDFLWYIEYIKSLIHTNFDILCYNFIYSYNKINNVATIYQTTTIYEEKCRTSRKIESNTI